MPSFTVLPAGCAVTLGALGACVTLSTAVEVGRAPAGVATLSTATTMFVPSQPSGTFDSRSTPSAGNEATAPAQGPLVSVPGTSCRLPMPQ